MEVSAIQILANADATLAERANLRDSADGERSMDACVNAFNMLTGNNLSALDGWKFMICLKLSRSKGSKFHVDDYIDIVGYGALAGEAASQTIKQ